MNKSVQLTRPESATCLLLRYDAHIMKRRPFFEGWYSRFVSPDNPHTSYGLVFAQVLAENSSTSSSSSPPSAYIAFFRSCGRRGKIDLYQEFPRFEEVIVTNHGKKVLKNPDWESDPDFQWAVGRIGFFKTVGNLTTVDMTINGTKIQAEFEASPWVYNGKPAPHSWSDVIDASPLHHYVHSLDSRIRRLSVSLPGAMQQTYTSGFVHQEKDWGRQFPPGWIWGEAIHETVEGSTVALSLVYGTLSTTSDRLKGHYLWFRDKELGIAWDFLEYNSLIDAEYDSCRFSAKIVVTDLSKTKRLEIEFRRTRGDTVSLYGPKKDGLRPDVCMESYSVPVVVKAFYKDVRMRRFEISNGALEFGGNYICQKKSLETQTA